MIFGANWLRLADTQAGAAVTFRCWLWNLLGHKGIERSLARALQCPSERQGRAGRGQEVGPSTGMPDSGLHCWFCPWAGFSISLSLLVPICEMGL